MITEYKVRQILDKPELIDVNQKYCSIMKQVSSVDATRGAIK